MTVQFFPQLTLPEPGQSVVLDSVSWEDKFEIRNHNLRLMEAQ
jgi:hypothetical protein